MFLEAASPRPFPLTTFTAYRRASRAIASSETSLTTITSALSRSSCSRTEFSVRSRVFIAFRAGMIIEACGLLVFIDVTLNPRSARSVQDCADRLHKYLVIADNLQYYQNFIINKTSHNPSRQKHPGQQNDSQPDENKGDLDMTGPSSSRADEKQGERGKYRMTRVALERQI